jgi:ribosomal protein S18 acetylase RimI-like enzyme
MREAHCFTTANRVEEWLLYLAHLHGGAVCGQFSAVLSGVVPAPDRSVAAALVATELGNGTAHIAQVAVAPAHQGQGVGETLVRECCSRAAAAGYRSVTLLVADSNARARRLYQRLGFEAIDQFLFGYRER